MSTCLKLLACACLVATAQAHASMVIPSPRNAVDHDIYPWNNTDLPPKYNGFVDQPFCPIRSEDGKTLTAKNGQACFWFSNGCSHGCQKCDGVHANGGSKQFSACGNYSSKATICDPNLRTYRRNTACGTPADFQYFNPWRAPGRAPVFDACGMAGGEPAAGTSPEQGAKYTATPHAKQGDLGSKTLPAMPTNTVWTAGEEAEVSWTMRANHGGGYSWRLCPRNESLSEECFQKYPLDFVGMQSLRWNGTGSNGRQIWFKGTYVAGEYTTPHGSMWSKNPIPVLDEDDVDGKIAPVGFKAPCEENRPCTSAGAPSTENCLCSGAYGPNNLEIVDKVLIPETLAPGEWVLGWRWDTESTMQVWTNCADVTIVAASTH